MVKSPGSLGMLLALLLVHGCAFVKVPLSEPVRPLDEQVIEGEGRAKILLVDVTGFISEKGRAGGQLGKEKPSMVADIRESLLKAEKDEDIVGVIVRINSPGGTVAASDIIRHEFIAFKERRKIPVYACITGIGASGGYYVATAADEISAHPTAITGSIGVLLMTFNVEGLLTKIGVTERTVKSGEKKDLLSLFRPATPEEERLVQEIIDRLARRFVEAVRSRHGNTLPKGELERLADGRIFTADQALAARLIDRIGYLDDAVAAMKKALNLEKARVVSYYHPGSYRGSIYSAAPDEGLNLLSAAAGGLEMLAGTEFMYLWKP
jgi:protease-4